MCLRHLSFASIRNALGVACAISLASAIVAPATAADWPSAKPIRVVVPFPPGGAGDVAIRTIQTDLAKVLGAQFYIESKSGASGNIGAQTVVSAPADGYTFLLGATNNYVTNQSLFKLSFDPLKDLVPVSKVIESTLILLVHPALPVKSLSELTTYARQNPGKVTIGSAGVGTMGHLSGVRYARNTNTPMTYVPYRGAAPAMMALLSGEIQALFTSVDVAAPYVQDGRARALAVSGSERLKTLPGVPSVGELGMPGAFAVNWWGLAAPAGTDPAIVAKMAAAVRDVLKRPEIIEQFARQGNKTVGSSPAEFSAELAREAADWKTIIEEAKIKLE